MSSASIQPFLNAFTAWAAAQSDIGAVALVGSHARNQATATSDIDLILITAQPARYLQNQEWVRQFGEIRPAGTPYGRKQQVEDYGLVTLLRVWYADGREVEYGITDERWTQLPLDAGTQSVIAAGMHVLFERAPLLSRHLTTS